MNRADGVEGEEVVAQALRVDSHSEHLWEGNTMMSNDEKNMNNWIPVSQPPKALSVVKT